MLSAARRQAKLAKKANAKKQRAKQRAAEEARLAQHRYHPDQVLLVLDKREELYGQGDIENGYSPEETAHVDAIIAAYTPEERAAALALAKALTWDEENLDSDNYDQRAEQRRQQGRGPLIV
jgi:hypothetical protein